MCAPCVLLLAAGCMTYSQRVELYRLHYGSGNFQEADLEVNRLIAEECGVEVEEIGPEALRDGSIDVSQGDAHLFLLEKAMALLGLQNAEGALDLLRAARDKLDERIVQDVGGYIGAAALDDTFLAYSGADYEHILVRVMLTICDLIGNEGQDAYAYVLQIGEKQEEIIGSNFGESEGYNPRQQYKRVAIGAYIEGLKREADLQPEEAAKAYQRAKEYAGVDDDHIIAAALERAAGGRFVEPGNGAIHVFYLAGRGPYLGETNGVVTELTTRLAGAAIAIVGGQLSALAQAPVPVPQVIVVDQNVPPIQVAIDGSGAAVLTQTILDVNTVAVQQLEANMPWIITRAVVRRALKSAVAAGVEEASRLATEQALGPMSGMFGLAMGVGVNLASTATERADTRNWSSLPAEIQTARIEAPEGEHVLSLGPWTTQKVTVRKGYNTFLVLLQPNLNRPGIVLVDPFSRPEQAPPELTRAP